MSVILEDSLEIGLGIGGIEMAGEKDLRTIIEGFLEEEASAGEEYVDLANMLKYFGYIPESEKIFDIAIDEGRHRATLKRVLKKLE